MERPRRILLKRLLLAAPLALCLAAALLLPPAPPLFGTDDELVELVTRTAAALDYTGEPLEPLPGDLETVILRNGYGHCGHFAYLLARKLERRGRKVRLYGITLRNGIIHVLVDLLDAHGRPERCLDGQLGLVYPAPLAELFARPDLADRALRRREPEPRFAPYFGRAFFSPDIDTIDVYEGSDPHGHALAATLPPADS